VAENLETSVKLRGEVVGQIVELQDAFRKKHGMKLTKQQVLQGAVQYALDNMKKKAEPVPHLGKVS
tara:strand:+ start:1395 stop:1592 length:198 start_codon:yes stop_codon:yes gene_type:complete